MQNLVYLIPLLPFLAFVAIVLLFNRNSRLSGLTAIVAIGLSWVISWAIVATAITTDHFYEHPIQLPLISIPTGTTMLSVGFTVDSLTALMLFMVPFVCLMIFIYSWGYMGVGKPKAPANGHDEHGGHETVEEHGGHGGSKGKGWPAGPEFVDPMASRFFAYISLFATGMLGLVLADSLVLLFIFWEIMGLCSYLLISFWFARKYDDPNRITPKKAGFKAFITTRVGDAIMFCGMMILYAAAAFLTDGQAGLTFSALFSPEVLEGLQTLTILGISVATLTAVLIFWGSIGKSAQFPLHVWLPDAMEGPTPVSALIHAATMVSAGVYLIIRMYPLMLAGSTPTLNFIAVIGAFTALFAAVIAVTQTDVKRVLAFSTISQLGYMFAALGIGAYIAAVFHLITHAFFKALLFLGSGSVIHGMEHGEHHVHEHGGHEVAAFDPNDMRYMGGLRHRMRGTFIAFLIGGLSLAGFPLITAGFWSKDEILAEAWYGFLHGSTNSTMSLLVFIALALGAFLTAFYTWRQISMTFLGQPRTESAKSASESSKSMVVPLLILAAFALLLGYAGVSEEFPIIGPILGNPLHQFLGHFAETLEIHAEVIPFDPAPVLISILMVFGGLGLSYLVYGRAGKGWQTYDQLDPLEAGMQRIGLGAVYNASRNKFYFDELYNATFVRFSLWLSRSTAWFDRTIIDGVVNAVGRFGRWLADILARFDRSVIDGIVNGIGSLAVWAGGVLRLVQTGQAQSYLLVALLTVLLLLALFFIQVVGIGVAG
ncbi:MAG: NADH-quinone oxidoreductase subunit L [Anaerolineales bacterium]|nr:NADH-quinone oxidoreductase subunit L [Anaerolineales bacterium]